MTPAKRPFTAPASPQPPINWNQIDIDHLVTAALWSGIVGSLAGTLLLGHLLPKQLKYAALSFGGLTSLIGLAYESREETKLLRGQRRQQRRQMIQQLAQAQQNQIEQTNLRYKIQAEAQTLETVQAMPEDLKQVMGVPSVTLGTPVDEDPATITVESTPANPVVQSPKDIAKATGKGDRLQTYLTFLVRTLVGKFGKEKMSLCIAGASREGKSTLAQALIYTVALQAIANRNRCIIMVLTRHGIDPQARKTDPYHPQWNGLPEVDYVPEGLESCIVKSTNYRDFVRYIDRLKTLMDERMAKDDYSWKDPESLTPQIILCVDEAVGYFRPMSEAERMSLAVSISSLAHEGSKFGVGLWLLMHDITKERTGVDPNIWASMQLLYGYKALKGPSGSGVEGREQAIATMKAAKPDLGAYGFYSEELGYFAPPPIQSTSVLLLDWAIPKVDIFDAQVSLVNVLRERVQNVATLEDRTLIALGIEWSTFTQEELNRMLPAIRALLALPLNEYEQRVAQVRAEIVSE